ncbi:MULTISPECIES: glycerol-3-phosphate 1-O-acyltransferase PlsY [unclassified Synechocystis]|uniref:glycerol-3-phosphate 1-O-acyltransferase PlsY n=1 Tax=unclassified Synechocystis TaxID=2640012 RepID=UPI00048C1B63|nr:MULTISPECIES: glycerol-3-phosphate 1-O-acyltransferase PlsY [unclassified Synechocystis]MCT0254637.1 glycerol-3-phosphate 1-O-acyltransferase PlsY [Synechocystis sp. CS-94]
MTTAPLLCLSLLLVTYLMGSLPTGYLAGKLLLGIDIRDHGSKSTGATNVFRTLGKPAAIAVLAIDIAKGAMAVALVQSIYANGWLPALPLGWQSWLTVGVAVAVVLGHSKSIFLNFSGGKSVATSLGVLFMLNIWLALGTLATFLAVISFTRIVSLSSIVAAIAVNGIALALQLPLPYLSFTLLAGIYVIVRHRSNIERILQGTEPKLGEKVSSLPERKGVA